MGGAERGKAPGIQGVSLAYQHYLACLLLHFAIPLLPLVLEFWRTRTLTTQTVSLLASLYAISLTHSSRSRVLFTLGVVLIALPMFVFWLVVGQHPATSFGREVAMLAIVGVALSHAAERWNRHVVDREPYLLFMKH